MLSQEIQDKYAQLCVNNPALRHPNVLTLEGCFKSPYTASELELQNWLFSKLPCHYAVRKYREKYQVIYATQAYSYLGEDSVVLATKDFPTVLEALLSYFENPRQEIR